MADQPAASRQTNFRAAAWALSVLLLTALHHVWGAIVYDTPWRLDVLHIVVPSALIITAALWLGEKVRRPGLARGFTWIAAIVTLLVPVALIGILEGGYNHLVKVVVYFTAGEEAAWQLFQPPLYEEYEVEMPNDFIFELTGIAQFPLAIIAGFFTVSMLRGTRRASRATPHPRNRG